MTIDSNPLAHLRGEILWLHVTLSARFDVPAIKDWYHRLQAHLRGHGLVAAISPGRIAVIPRQRPLTPSDRGVVLGWLVSQPEVVVVRIHSRTISASVEQQDPTLKGLPQ